MRKNAVRIALALALCALTVGTASAKVKSKALTIGTDFWVGDTLVKKGTYRMVYDDEAGELSIVNKETTVARVSARAEKREQARFSWDVTLSPKDGKTTLVSLAFPGDKQTLVLGGAVLADKSK